MSLLFPGRRSADLLIFLLLGLGASCAGSVREPVETTAASPRRYTEADVRFMQNMVIHHAQALAMTDLVPDRAAGEDIRTLARRIEVSQKDEIQAMERWLETRGEPVLEGHDHDHLMPGMLTEEELSRLAGATGDEFDRLFLEYMIRHHEGALVMVADLFSAGGGQEAQIFQIASNVDADQRAEIARMRDMLNTPSQEDRE